MTLPMPEMDIVKPLKEPLLAAGTELFCMMLCVVKIAWQVCTHKQSVRGLARIIHRGFEFTSNGGLLVPCSHPHALYQQRRRDYEPNRRVDPAIVTRSPFKKRPTHHRQRQIGL